MALPSIRKKKKMSKNPTESKQTALDSNIDEALLLLIDLGQVPMAWDEESDDFVFYVNEEHTGQTIVDVE